MAEISDRDGIRFFAITRDISSSSGFRDSMRNFGWSVISLKTNVIIPKSTSDLTLVVSKIIHNEYDTCIFLSGNAVSILMGSAESTGNRLALVSKLRSIRTICIGPRTGEKLAYYGIDSVIVPEKSSSDSLITYISANKSGTSKIVIPRSQLGDTSIVHYLTMLGIHVDQFHIYDTVTNSVFDREWIRFFELLRQRKIVAIGFTSPSSVRAFFQILSEKVTQEDLSYVKRLKGLISIGDSTTAELKRHSPGPFIEAVEHTLKGILEASKSV
jgi:uroporphyrinogen-III synthase